MHRMAKILLVDDNPADVELIREVLLDRPHISEVHVCHDGLDALDYLRRNDGTAPKPDLILLDVNMPRMTGPEFLEIVKKDPELRQVPVIMLTSSDDPDDIRKAYDRHANAYLIKPIGFQEMLRVVGDFDAFWLHTAVLPT